MKNILLFALCASVAAGACKTTRPDTNAASGDLKKRTPKFLIEQLEKNTLRYDWFAAKAKAQLHTPDEDLGFTADIHLKKDSIIWVAVKKLGFEGLRVRITPERFELLNHLEKQYVSRPFSFLSSQFNLPLDFEGLQNLLVGNPLPLDEQTVRLSTEAGRYVLSQNRGEVELALHLNSTFFRIEKWTGQLGNNHLVVLLDNYQPAGTSTTLIALDKKLEVNGGEMRLDLMFNKVEIDQPAKTAFNIPEHYQKVLEGQ